MCVVIAVTVQSCEQRKGFRQWGIKGPINYQGDAEEVKSIMQAKLDRVVNLMKEHHLGLRVDSDWLDEYPKLYRTGDVQHLVYGATVISMDNNMETTGEIGINILSEGNSGMLSVSFEIDSKHEAYMDFSLKQLCRDINRILMPKQSDMGSVLLGGELGSTADD